MPRVSPRQLLLALLLVVSVLFLLSALRRAQPDQPNGSVAERDMSGIPGGRPMDRAGAEVELASAAPSDTDFSRYAALARTNVFSKQRTQAPPPKPKPVPPPPPLPNGNGGKPKAPKVDFSAWTYVGYVALDGEELGIVQNDTTHTCEYLAVGDEFMGAVVTAVDRESMKLKAGASRTTLSRPRDFAMTPLGKSASKQPERARPRPGQPQG